MLTRRGGSSRAEAGRLQQPSFGRPPDNPYPLSWLSDKCIGGSPDIPGAAFLLQTPQKKSAKRKGWAGWKPLVDYFLL